MSIQNCWRNLISYSNDVWKTSHINDITSLKLARTLNGLCFHQIMFFFLFFFFFCFNDNIHFVRNFCCWFCFFSFRRILFIYLNRNIRFVSNNVTTSIEKDQLADLEKNIIKRKAQLHEIEQILPQKNGTYLKVRNFQQYFFLWLTIRNEIM